MVDSVTEARKRQIARPDGARPPTARKAMALAKSKAYQDGADAEATLRAYATDVANFGAWCAKHGFTAMPATPETVGAYLAAAGEGYAMPTLRRRFAAIARACGVGIERSKTDKQGEGAEIAIPRGKAEETCPVAALKDWLALAEITVGPLFRKVNRGGAVESARLSTDGVRQILLKRAAAAGMKGTLAEPVSPHGLRAGFVTTAYRNGVPDEEIMGHTRHRSLTTMRSYVRRAKLSQASPAGKLGL